MSGRRRRAARLERCYLGETNSPAIAQPWPLPSGVTQASSEEETARNPSQSAPATGLIIGGVQTRLGRSHEGVSLPSRARLSFPFSAKCRAGASVPVVFRTVLQDDRQTHRWHGKPHALLSQIAKGVKEHDARNSVPWELLKLVLQFIQEEGLF